MTESREGGVPAFEDSETVLFQRTDLERGAQSFSRMQLGVQAAQHFASTFGTVRIDARRRTHLKAPLPRGGIRLRVECLGAPPLRQYSAFALQRVDSDEQPVSILRQLRVESKDDATLEWPGTLDIPHVPAGLWEATCRSRGYDCDTVRVTVADTMADLTLQLRKQ